MPKLIGSMWFSCGPLLWWWDVLLFLGSGDTIWVPGWYQSVSWLLFSEIPGSKTISERSYCLELVTPLPSLVCFSEGLSLSAPHLKQTCVLAERLDHLQNLPFILRDFSTQGDAIKQSGHTVAHQFLCTMSYSFDFSFFVYLSYFLLLYVLFPYPYPHTQNIVFWS